MTNNQKEPRTVNVFGCCCSRNIFNYPPASEVFKINRFAFQVSVWSCFGTSLEIPSSDIQKIKERPFTLRMIDYDFNKIACREFEKSPSDYFMIDLTSMSFPVYRIGYKGKETYVQNWLASSFMPTLKDIPGFETFYYKKMTIQDVPEAEVYNGLDQFCSWVLELYRPDQILLYLPRRAEQYILPDGEVRIFKDETILPNRKLDERISIYTEYVKNKLNGCHFVKYSKTLTAYDKETGNAPPPALHYTMSNYIEQGKMILNELGIDYSDYSENNLKIWETILIEQERTLHELTTKTEQLENSSKFVTINNYFKLLRAIKDINDYIIFFVCREDMSILLDKFTERKKYGLSKMPAFKESYIAVFNGSEGVVYEESKASALYYEYSDKAFSQPVRITSGGTCCVETGERVVASVIIDGKEYSLNLRGCNIIIYRKSTRTVVDSVVCDLNRDKTLKVRSKYEENYLEKILHE